MIVGKEAEPYALEIHYADHAIANDGAETLALVSIQSPAVSADELFSRRLAVQAAGYDGEYDDDE